ncbi:MAG: ATP-binding protein [Sphingomicrobium sp.]
MSEEPSVLQAVVDALDEPALIVEVLSVGFANDPAKALLGAGIEGRDIRLAIRHPEALELILGARSGAIEARGIGEPGRSWRVVARDLGHGSMLVRLVDRSAAVSAEKMRVDFVANASHELRTPLSTVLGYAETLAEETDLAPELRTKFGRAIGDEAGRMLRIIEDLMSLSRIEADRFLAPTETVSIEEVVTTSVANASHSRCELVVDIAPDLPPVRGDPGQLVQVLDNLIGNAVRYGCDSAASRIDISVDRSGRWIVVTVTDHGAGIPRDHLPRVTERFYRVDAARSRESGGTGLGLAIVKHIVERHRGSLHIKSAVGSGTSVAVRLPLAS